MLAGGKIVGVSTGVRDPRPGTLVEILRASFRIVDRAVAAASGDN